MTAPDGDRLPATSLPPVPYDQHERDMLRLIGERDRLEDIADQLAAAIAPADVLGEHSSDNNPWRNALDYADTATQQRDRLPATNSGQETRHPLDWGGPGEPALPPSMRPAPQQPPAQEREDGCSCHPAPQGKWAGRRGPWHDESCRRSPYYVAPPSEADSAGEDEEDACTCPECGCITNACLCDCCCRYPPRHRSARSVASEGAKSDSADEEESCQHPDVWFDRVVCPDPCGGMHEYCTECGVAVRGCLNDVPASPGVQGGDGEVPTSSEHRSDLISAPGMSSALDAAGEARESHTAPDETHSSVPFGAGETHTDGEARERLARRHLLVCWPSARPSGS